MHIRHRATVWLACALLAATAWSQEAPAEKAPIDLFADVDLARVTSDQPDQVSVARPTDAQRVAVTCRPGKDDNPGIVIKPKGLVWDLSAFAHVEACVSSVPQYLLFNAVSGGWGGNDLTGDGLPDDLVTDHVRAWQLPGSAPKERTAPMPPNPPPDTLAADSPVQFPASGALPAKYPPDLPAQDGTSPEEGYYLFSTPERSLEQIRAIQAEMAAGQFTPPVHDWTNLPRTRRILTEGGELRMLGLGDSIVNDTMRSGWVGLLQEAYPKATIRGTVYVRGGGGCQHYKEEGLE